MQMYLVGQRVKVAEYGKMGQVVKVLPYDTYRVEVGGEVHNLHPGDLYPVEEETQEILSISEFVGKYPWLITDELIKEFPYGTGHSPLIDHSPSVSAWIVYLKNGKPLQIEPQIWRMEPIGTLCGPSPRIDVGHLSD